MRFASDEHLTKSRRSAGLRFRHEALGQLATAGVAQLRPLHRWRRPLPVKERYCCANFLA